MGTNLCDGYNLLLLIGIGLLDLSKLSGDDSPLSPYALPGLRIRKKTGTCQLPLKTKTKSVTGSMTSTMNDTSHTVLDEFLSIEGSKKLKGLTE